MATSALGIVTARHAERASWWDALFVGLAGLHAVVLVLAPTIPVLAIGLWWNSNTIAHNFIHRPFFRSRIASAGFSIYLSILLGVPQSLWRQRHLAHHGGVRCRLRLSPLLAVETFLVLCVWLALAVTHPHFFLATYLPAYVIGLTLCALQGHYEHARGVISHYGRLYNWLCFNDGYHAEHHSAPAAHWSSLPSRVAPRARASRWPAPLRWMDHFSLEGLERMVLRSPSLQRWVLRSHRQAFCNLLSQPLAIERIAIVGGGLYPRTALILRELLPHARITIIDADASNLDTARRFLHDPNIEFVHRRFLPGDSPDCDLLVIPLSFNADRDALYRRPPARIVLAHDWIWRRRGASRIVSLLFLKRLNLVRS